MDANTWVMLIGIAVGLVVYWKKGGNQASSDANSALMQVTSANKLQIEQMSDKIKGLEDRERLNLGEIGRLNGVVSEKEARIKILENVRATLDPETAKILTYIGSVAKNSESFMTKSDGREDAILKALTRISEFMQKINDHMDKAHSVVV